MAKLAKPSWWVGWIHRVKPTVRLGVRDWSVAYLQSVLSIRAGQTAVHVTGLFDAATDQAVRNVKRIFGRQQTWPVIDLLAAT